MVRNKRNTLTVHFQVVKNALGGTKYKNKSFRLIAQTDGLKWIAAGRLVVFKYRQIAPG